MNWIYRRYKIYTGEDDDTTWTKMVSSRDLFEDTKCSNGTDLRQHCNYLIRDKMVMLNNDDGTTLRLDVTINWVVGLRRGPFTRRCGR